MIELAYAVVGASVLALCASALITRAARYSPVVNIMLGAVAVVAGFCLLLFVFLVFQRMASHP